MWHILIIACSTYAPSECYPATASMNVASIEACKLDGADHVATFEWFNPDLAVRAWTCRGPELKGASHE